MVLAYLPAVSILCNRMGTLNVLRVTYSCKPIVGLIAVVCQDSGDVTV
jgi:hypothetical protein